QEGGEQPAPANGEQPAGATAIEVIAGKPAELQFDPSQITIPANTEVTVTLRNEGALPHNFAVDELGISVDVQPGEETQFTINAPAGQYEFYCNVPGHREGGMVGTLVVE